MAAAFKAGDADGMLTLVTTQIDAMHPDLINNEPKPDLYGDFVLAFQNMIEAL